MTYNEPPLKQWEIDLLNGAFLESEPVPSMFDNFGGYYSVMIDGVEFSRHAPSSVWTAMCFMLKKEYGDSFSYRFVSNS